MCNSRRRYLGVVLGLMVAALPLAGCQQAGEASAGEDEANNPATIVKIEGTEISRLTLTPKAAERLDIKTTAVVEAQKERAGKTSLRKVVPYAAVLYDATGATWVYTNPEPLVFVRQQITVDYIEGDVAVLSDGPATGVKVVTLGASLLLGTEFEVGES